MPACGANDRVELGVGVARARDPDLGGDTLLSLHRDSPGRPNVQVGLRYLLVTDRVELFISGGERIGDRDSWFAKFGVRFQSWKLF